jgi:hypothetical protein
MKGIQLHASVGTTADDYRKIFTCISHTQMVDQVMILAAGCGVSGQVWRCSLGRGGGGCCGERQEDCYWWELGTFPLHPKD